MRYILGFIVGAIFGAVVFGSDAHAAANPTPAQIADAALSQMKVAGINTVTALGRKYRCFYLIPPETKVKPDVYYVRCNYTGAVKKKVDPRNTS